MKIAISAVGINHRAGTGRYVSELLRHLVLSDQKNEYFIFLSPGQMEDIKYYQNADNFKWYIVPNIWHNVILGTIWNITYLLSKLIKEDIDLVHFLDMNRCFIPHFCPILITVHGLIAFQVENKDGRLRGFYHEKIEPFGLKKANMLIAVSNNTKEDIINIIGIPESKIAMLPNGCTVWPDGDINLKDSENPSLRKIKFQYILFVSRVEHPNKNHVTLLHAFKKLLIDSNSNLQLVCVGQEGWRFDYVLKTINELMLNESVVFTGFVSNLELKSLYLGARAFVMPSLYEGFGIPIIEAMSMRLPVACSNTSSLKEIAQNAALMFDPNNYEEICETLKKVLWDEEVRKVLIENGIKQSLRYNWQTIAMETIKLYESIKNDTKINYC